MHVCIPCHDKEEFVVGYVKRFEPKLVIVGGTVSLGTTMALFERCGGCCCLVAHSSVRGVNKSLEHIKWELRRWKKICQQRQREIGKRSQKHFEKACLKTKVLKSCLRE
ncbi:MAG: hypothetical protein QW228_08720 [Candidatus Aenigmatarchaeota archaeon]